MVPPLDMEQMRCVERWIRDDCTWVVDGLASMPMPTTDTDSLRKQLFGQIPTFVETFKYGGLAQAWGSTMIDDVVACPAPGDLDHVSRRHRILGEIALQGGSARSRTLVAPQRTLYLARNDPAALAEALTAVFGRCISRWETNDAARELRETVLHAGKPLSRAGYIVSCIEVGCREDGGAVQMEMGWVHHGPTTHAEREAFKDRLIATLEAFGPSTNAHPHPVPHVIAGDPPKLRMLYKFNPQPYEPGNYPTIDRELRRVFAEICGPEPFGRLVVLSGAPGTGKTRAIEGTLLSRQRKAILGPKAASGGAVVIVPHDMYKNLSTPELLSQIDEYVTSAGTERVGFTLLLEDADEALRCRTEGAASPVAALLNLADGILGRAHDLRIVATTNLTDQQMDPAVRRPGRLLAHIKVPMLSDEDAMRILNRLICNNSALWAEVGLRAAMGRGKAESPIAHLRAQLYLGDPNGVLDRHQWTLAELYETARAARERNESDSAAAVETRATP